MYSMDIIYTCSYILLIIQQILMLNYPYLNIVPERSVMCEWHNRGRDIGGTGGLEPPHFSRWRG